MRALKELGVVALRIKAERDELLAALLILREDHSRVEPHHEGICAICQQADAAIKKATT